MSSNTFWIFFFHLVGMILRTGLLHRFKSAAAGRRPCHETSCGIVAANPRRSTTHSGTQVLFYPSGGDKPMVLQRF
jgi:hypothetical protein